MAHQHAPETLRYHVIVTRQDDAHAVAETRGHTLTLNVKKGDGAAGLNAAETLLAALGACLLTNVNTFAAKMRLRVDAARVEFDAVRRDGPPGLTQIDYRLILASPEPRERLEKLHQLSVEWGTVSNTLMGGIQPNGTVVIEPPMLS